MLLESVKHAGSSFVTLTYSDENVPHVGKIKRRRFISSELPRRQTLDKYEIQRWIKRLRSAVAPQKIRFFLVGEYGDLTFRPHYHAAIFGLSPIQAGGLDGKSGIVQSTWSLGHTFCGQLTPDSAQYVAGYVTKKMTKKDDRRLCGRYPEFSRMSLRPGIGAAAIDDVSEVVSSINYYPTLLADGDVPSSLVTGSRRLPIGRYLRRRLRKKLGGSGDAPLSAQRDYSLKMRVLLEDHAKTQETPSSSLANLFVDMNKQKVLNLEAKASLNTGDKKL